MSKRTQVGTDCSFQLYQLKVLSKRSHSATKLRQVVTMAIGLHAMRCSMSHDRSELGE